MTHLFVNGDLVLVGGVEGDLADLLVLGPVGHGVSSGQLGTLENGSFGSITVDLTLQDGNSRLARLELGSVAETSNAFEISPG